MYWHNKLNQVLFMKKPEIQMTFGVVPKHTIPRVYNEHLGAVRKRLFYLGGSAEKKIVWKRKHYNCMVLNDRGKRIEKSHDVFYEQPIIRNHLCMSKYFRILIRKNTAKNDFYSLFQFKNSFWSQVKKNLEILVTKSWCERKFS